jgi:hypothetical protein
MKDHEWRTRMAAELVALPSRLAVGEAAAELQLAATPRRRALPKDSVPFGWCRKTVACRCGTLPPP